jgi:hypothetical protein
MAHVLHHLKKSFIKEEVIFMVKRRLLLLVVFMGILFLPAFASGEALWDQALSELNTQAYYSQDYTEDDLSDMWLADDFTNTKIWQISKIFIPGDFRTPESGECSNSFLCAGVESLNWEIYGNDGMKPDGDPSGRGNAPVWSLSLPGNDPQIVREVGTSGFYSNITVNIDEENRPLLSPNTYWLVFYPRMASTVGVYGRQPSLIDNDTSLIAKVVQPEGGDGYPTEWTSVLSVTWPVDKFPIELTRQNFAFRLDGTALDANIVVDPTTIDFGEELVGLTSDEQTVTISNTGTTDLLISSITITGDPEPVSMFDVATGATNGCTLTNQTLAPDESCTVSVTFAPSASGAQSAALAIASDDPDTATTQVALSGTGVEEAVPSVTEGTVGTEITFTAGPGISFGDKKGKVLIQNADVTSNTKIAKDGWSSTSITCTVNKALPAGVYDVKIMLQPYADDVSIDLPGAFTFKKPEVDILAVSDGAKGDLRTITGHFFGNKKPKVYLVYQDKKGVDKKKNCPVTSMITWVVDTGISSIQFKVPGGLAAGTYPLYVERKGVGTSEEEIDFTITE